jgi:phospholipid/cholesterol/gamma-HCH transport system substrate-binding protein
MQVVSRDVTWLLSHIRVISSELPESAGATPTPAVHVGALNIPCETKPGKRAPTAAMCESDENYVPLNDGYNWKGDPNATTSGQAIPQLPPGTPGSTALPPAPLAVAEYDPATGTYVGPDGKTYTQANLARDANQHQTWQDMLSPPKGH